VILVASVELCWVCDCFVCLLGRDSHVLVILVLVLVLIAYGVTRCLVEGHRGRVVHVAQILKEAFLYLVEVLGRVEILHVGGRDVEFEVGGVVLEVVIVRQFVRNVLVERDSCLVRPTPRHVPDGVAAAAKEEHGDVEPEDVLHAHRGL